MNKERGTSYRYSLVFQQKVVSEIENGTLTLGEANRLYGIRGTMTIYKWLRKLGKNHLIKRVVRVEMKGEKDRIKELERENRRLKEALADEHIAKVAFECLVEVASEELKIDLKKNYGNRLPRGVKRV